LTLLDRLLSALVTLAAGAVSAVVLMPDVGTLGLAVAGILLATVAWLVRGTGTRQVQGLAAPRVPLRGWLANLAAATLFNIVFFIQMSLLVGAGGELSTAVLWAVPAVFAIKTLLPISFLDLGVREAAAVGVLSLVGVTPAVALQASLILFALNVLVPGALGLLVLEREAVTRLAPRLAHVR
jgi:hypothetical protein